MDLLSLFYTTAMPVLDVCVMAGIGFIITKKVTLTLSVLIIQQGWSVNDFVRSVVTGVQTLLMK